MWTKIQEIWYSFLTWLEETFVPNINGSIPHRDEQEIIPEKSNKFGIIECEVEDLHYLESEDYTENTTNDGEILPISSDRPER